jgi:hypothetical protein
MTPHEKNVSHPAPKKYQRFPYIYADSGEKLKVCTQCLSPQPLDAFAKSEHCRDGIYPRCKLCCNNNNQEIYKKIRDKRRISRDAWMANNKEILKERNRTTLNQYLKFVENGGQEKTKVCTRCKGDPQPLSNFNIHLMHSDGYASQCKKCGKETSAVWYEKNKEAVVARDHKNRKRTWAGRAVSSCRRRASKKHIPFDMDASDLYDPRTGKLPTHCPLFPSITLDYEAGSDRRNWASVDRIVPELGYVKGNVCVMSYCANTWKTNGTNPEERERITYIMTGTTIHNPVL